MFLPVPDAMFGNLKLRWCKDPILYANSTVRNVDYETGQIYLNENVEKEKFPDLRISICLNLIVYNFCYYVGIKALIKLNKTILY